MKTNSTSQLQDPGNGARLSQPPQRSEPASLSILLRRSAVRGCGAWNSRASGRLCALLFALPLAAFAAGYDEKPEPPTPKKDDGCVNEPLTPEQIQGAQARARAYAATNSLYPYYANTPEELVPFSKIEPFYRYWTSRLPFRGPGKDYPPPPNLKSLKIGLLSPAPYGPEGARGRRTKKGVEMAFEEANAARRPGELPFEIFYREDAPQWGSAANITVEFADNEVLGFLGTIDGDATHVALRATLKLETYMINTSDPDPTLTETQIPWLTRVFPDDRQQCVRLAELVVKQHGCQRIAVFRESSRPGRVGVMHFVNYIRRLGVPPVQHVFFKPGDKSIGPQVEAIKAADCDAVLFYGQPDDVGRFAAEFRRAGIKAKFFGFDRLKEDAFGKAAGAAAEGTTICYFFNPDRADQPWVEFVEKFQKRYGEKPDIYAAYGYDGAKLMIQGVRATGPNRYRIRDYLAGLDEYDGVTGHMIFDGRWDNIVPIATAQFREGKWHFEATTPVARDKVKLSQR
ncbi:MAG: ABC transporter substrate-binding protein [Verrucomicrobia bacterium]|nr:ABC transporter substrate-binding protein [Verrucomicrobiota bacterium]